MHVGLGTWVYSYAPSVHDYLLAEVKFIIHAITGALMDTGDVVYCVQDC